MPLIYSKADAASFLRAPAQRARRLTPCAQAEANATRALEAVSKYGHLRCCDLGAVSPHVKYGLQLAQRLARRLVQSGHLAPRPNALGSRSFVLTRRGVAYLEDRGIPARHGLDLSSVSGGTCRHSLLEARFCISQEAAGFQAWHEHGIAQGHAPLTKQQVLRAYGKLPDAILVKNGMLWLIEIETAVIKSALTLGHCLAAAEKCGVRLHEDVPLLLQGIVFVFDARLAHGERITRIARSRWKDRCATDRAALARRVLLAKVNLGLPLVFRSVTQEPLPA